MEPNATSAPGAAGAQPYQFPTYEEAFFPVQRALTAYRRASECLLQGFMEVAAKQAEFNQKIMLEAMSEWQDMTRVRGPEELLQTEFSFARNNAERSIDAMRAFNDDIRHCCFHAVDLAVGEINAAVAKEPAAKKKTRSAA
jgi:hypothetical protein